MGVDVYEKTQLYTAGQSSASRMPLLSAWNQAKLLGCHGDQHPVSGLINPVFQTKHLAIGSE